MVETVQVWLEIAVGVATIAAALFAGVQVRQYVVQQRATDRMERDGVSLMWRAILAPSGPDHDGRNGYWKIEYTLTNPGRFPIDNVKCVVRLGTEVRTARHDSTLGEPTTTIVLYQTVLAGGATRVWSRSFVVPFPESNSLIGKTRAEVSFRDAEGNQHTTVWPRPAQSHSESATR